MKVFVGCDHAGFETKKEILDILEQLDCVYEDVGFFEFKLDDDYPMITKKVCARVLSEKNSFGILICGSGVGVCIAANKINLIRAVLGFDTYSSKMARLDEDANVLTLRSREFDHSKYYEIIKVFLETDFIGESRHRRRINEIEVIEKENK